MTEDVFVVDIPVFMPVYEPDKKYGWSQYKDHLWEALNKATNGHCMYCYNTIVINREIMGHIEHSIEKVNSKRLENCVPNMGSACIICNEKYKRQQETARKLQPKFLKEFETGECKKYDCKGICDKLEQLREEYICSGKIVIQPFEAKIKKDGHVLKLQYDLLNCKYRPSQSGEKYTTEEMEIIHNHIKLFGLNDPKRKNYEVGKYCKNVIDDDSLMIGKDYNNLIVDLFREKLQKLDITDAVKICRIVYENAFMRLAT